MNKRWINTKVEFIWDGTQYVEQSVDGYWYDGEMALCIINDASADGNDWGWRFINTYGSDSMVYMSHSDAYGMHIRADGATASTYLMEMAAVNSIGADTKFTVMGDGKTGIGISAPEHLLHIYKASSSTSVMLGCDNDQSAIYYFGAGTEAIYRPANTNDMKFYVNNADRMTITSSGKVGIGTAAPAQVLHVAGGNLSTIRNNMFGITSNTPAASGETNAYHNAYYDTTNSREEYLVADEACKIQFINGQINFRTAAAGSADGAITWINAMGILADGKVGIGTSDPVSPLNIKSNTTNDVESGFTFTANADTTTLANLYEGNTKDGILQLHDGGAVKIRLCTAGDSHFSGGNVGIGTSSPAALMHTYGSSNTAAKFESTDANCNIIITDSGGSGINIKAVGDVATISTGDTMAMTIDASQNVGIGDSSPSYKLEVAGTFYASGSSQAFKKNVTDLAVDSSAIYNLNPVSYNYKKDYENFGYDLAEGKQFGLISEEVAEAVPELAIMKDGEPKNVDYQKLSVLLLAEMQKMNKRIKDLECHI